jgi:hypothetical protein
MKMTQKMPAANERFGATAGGSADLKGSGEIPPLRQAATPLCVSRESVVEKTTHLKEKYSPTMKRKK